MQVGRLLRPVAIVVINRGSVPDEGRRVCKRQQSVSLATLKREWNMAKARLCREMKMGLVVRPESKRRLPMANTRDRSRFALHLRVRREGVKTAWRTFTSEVTQEAFMCREDTACLGSVEQGKKGVFRHADRRFSN